MNRQSKKPNKKRNGNFWTRTLRAIPPPLSKREKMAIIEHVNKRLRPPA